MYVFSNELANRGVAKMQTKNIHVTKDGMKVGVKEVKTEDYEDKTQKYAFSPPKPLLLLLLLLLSVSWCVEDSTGIID
jgi:hypothetical protein